MQTNIIDRCYELANSGAYEGTVEIRRQLIAEGYSQGLVSVHLAGPLLKKRLSDFCSTAQAKAKLSPPNLRPSSVYGVAATVAVGRLVRSAWNGGSSGRKGG